MSEKPGNQAQEEHSKKKETSFLARMLGWSLGRRQAEAAEPDVKNLADRIKRLGPEAAEEAIDAAIAAYSQEREKQEQAEKPPEKPE